MQSSAVASPTEAAARPWRPVRFPVEDGTLALDAGNVHVWMVELEPTDGVLAAFRATLDDEERARAERFAFDRHRRRYVAAHGLLRHLVSGYLGVPPQQLRFGFARHGKPYLPGETLRFNLAHSGSRMLLAVADGRELGVDLELVDGDRDVAGIARHFFSPNEVAALTALPARERRPAFYRCWTRKEAYIKACGTGLALRLDSFDVSLESGARSALLWSALGADEPIRWMYADLPVGRRFEAALAVEGDDWRLATFALEVPE